MSKRYFRIKDLIKKGDFKKAFNKTVRRSSMYKQRNPAGYEKMQADKRAKKIAKKQIEKRLRKQESRKEGRKSRRYDNDRRVRTPKERTPKKPQNQYQDQINDILEQVEQPQQEQTDYAQLIADAQAEAQAASLAQQQAAEQALRDQLEEQRRFYEEQQRAQAAEQARIAAEQEAARKRAELERNVAMQNMARSGLNPQFQFGSMGGTSPDQYGTSGFKRRLEIQPQVSRSLNTLASRIASRFPMTLNI